MPESNNRSKYMLKALYYLGLALTVTGATFAGVVIGRNAKAEFPIGDMYSYYLIAGGALTAVVGMAVMVLASRKSRSQNVESDTASDGSGK